MATNPQYPAQGPVPAPPRHPRVPTPRKQFPWPLIGIIVAAAILAAIIAWLPRAPKAQTPPTAAQVPPQPTGSQIQLSNLKIAPAPGGGALDLDGMLINNGNTSINGIQVELSFKNLRGETLETQNLPVEGVVTDKQGKVNGTQGLAQAPIQPRQSRPFRISITHVPEGWNRNVPEMRIVKVTGANP